MILFTANEGWIKFDGNAEVNFIVEKCFKIYHIFDIHLLVFILYDLAYSPTPPCEGVGEGLDFRRGSKSEDIGTCPGVVSREFRTFTF